VIVGMDPLLDLPPDLPVPELDLARAVEAPPRAVEAPRIVEPPSAAPGGALELAVAPRWHVATGVRSKACPVCLCELSLAQWVCHECGERLGVDHGLVVAGAPWAERPSGRQPRRLHGALQALADAAPMSVGKRLLLYPLLAIFFCNLLIPCRFHQTGACLLLALVGAVIVLAHAAVAARSASRD